MARLESSDPQWEAFRIYLRDRELKSPQTATRYAQHVKNIMNNFPDLLAAEDINPEDVLAPASLQDWRNMNMNLQSGVQHRQYQLALRAWFRYQRYLNDPDSVP